MKNNGTPLHIRRMMERQQGANQLRGLIGRLAIALKEKEARKA